MRQAIAGFPLNAMLSPGSVALIRLPSDHLRVCRDVFADPAGEVAVGRCDPDGDGVGCPVGLADDVGLAVGFAVGDAVELGVVPGLDRTTKGRDVNTSVFLPFWAWPVPLVAVTSKT